MVILDSVVKEDGQIRMRTVGQVDVSERKIKVGSPGCIWDASLGENFLEEGEWLTSGGVARVGVSAAVILTDARKPRAIMSRFDSGHPTAAGKLTPPAGVWESGSLLQAALKELGEEVLPVVGNYVVPWRYIHDSENGCLEWVHVHGYAYDRGMWLSSNSVILVENFEDGGRLAVDVYEVYVDDVRQGRAIMACEPENGGIEVIFLLRCREAVFEKLVDGERNRGVWLDREVRPWTVEDLAGESLTTKAREVMEVMRDL